MYNLIHRDTVNRGDQIQVSVYCYVSAEFNGDWVRISSEGETRGIRESNYDLSRRGSWQKLEFATYCDSGFAPVYLYFKQSGNTDFSNLRGYVIFAYPTYNRIEENQEERRPE